MCNCLGGMGGRGTRHQWIGDLHSAKGGAVETGCSDLNDVIHNFTI